MKSRFAVGLCAVAVLLLVSSASAGVVTYQAILNGPSESPANSSPGTGYAQIVYDDVLHSMTITGSFANLTANTTASHFHAATAVPGTGTAGVATTIPSFTGFPLGVTSGTFNLFLDLTQSSSFNPAFVTANGGTVASAEAALVSAIATGRSYMNIHTTAFPNGEIRGFLFVPLPAALPAGLAMLGAVFATRWFRRRKEQTFVKVD